MVFVFEAIHVFKICGGKVFEATIVHTFVVGRRFQSTLVFYTCVACLCQACTRQQHPCLARSRCPPTTESFHAIPCEDALHILEAFLLFKSGVGKFVDAVVAFRICVGNMCLKISLFTEFEFANPFEARVVLNICVGGFLEVVVDFKSCIGKSFKS